MRSLVRTLIQNLHMDMLNLMENPPVDAGTARRATWCAR